MMRNLVLLLCALFLTLPCTNAMTEAQLKAAVRLIRNVCQPKFKATDEQITAMHKGDWDQDHNGQCYMWCVLNNYKLMSKDNQFDWQAGVKTLQDMAPDSIKSGAIQSVKNCKDAVKTTSDKCAAGFEVGKCIYLDNPGNYFLP